MIMAVVSLSRSVDMEVTRTEQTTIENCEALGRILAVVVTLLVSSTYQVKVPTNPLKDIIKVSCEESRSQYFHFQKHDGGKKGKKNQTKTYQELSWQASCVLPEGWNILDRDG